jgi:alkanesulfonate monooxygenase SsuD/methylene tetrahydromethanopterin reductase-like flavin-dependent oxidoreductase (luciferase family)
MELLLGVNVATSAEPGADPVADAVRAERLGFDFVSASDHPSGERPTFETWTMLSWIAAATTRIRVATRVLGVPYRSPAMVAKMAETFDRLSDGRLILGLGGGYSDEEFRAFGLDVPGPRAKVDGLRDAIGVIRGLWSPGRSTYDGALHHTADAPMEPKPGHRIPIWLGTYGPRALALTGELADGWIPSLGFAGPDDVPAMRARIEAAAREAGRDPAELRLVYNVPVRVDPGAAGSDGVVAGGGAEVADRLRSLLELGFTGLNLMPSGPDAAEQVERLAADVLPALRQT